MNTNLNLPTVASIDLVPAVPLKAGDRIRVWMESFRGTPIPHSFIAGSVKEYAERYGEDPQAAIDRAKGRGHALYYMVAEGAMITAHPQTPVDRIVLQLGTIVEIDGFRFQVLRDRNDNLRLAPLQPVE